MDWFLDASDVEAMSELRVRIGDYLRRHCTADSDVDGSELIASELLTNAVRHAGSAAWVTLEWSDDEPVLTVFDLGPGFELDPALPRPEEVAGRGLFIASAIATELRAVARRAGGTAVSARLPARRPPAVPIDMPRHRHGRLPALSDVRPGGGFGRETFLLAVAVQLAQTSEETVGADVVERLIAQVGADVGAQMEIEYREANGITGPLSNEQLADCLVRLKRGIGGGFYVIDVGEDRVVLGNTACPFGDTVRRAPTLCRMTSSVFGGIAASTTGRPVAVDLQERIAVGDHGCRVVIDLAPTEVSQGHRYGAPATTSAPDAGRRG